MSVAEHDESWLKKRQNPIAKVFYPSVWSFLALPFLQAPCLPAAKLASHLIL